MFIIACPIKGQIRLECASDPSCHLACNSTEPVPCLSICVVNGCQCPAGTVIDWERNECVRPRQCRGMYECIVPINNIYKRNVCTYVRMCVLVDTHLVYVYTYLRMYLCMSHKILSLQHARLEDKLEKNVLNTPVAIEHVTPLELLPALAFVL